MYDKERITCYDLKKTWFTNDNILKTDTQREAPWVPGIR